MNIIFDARYVTHEITGVGQYTRFLLETLLNLDSDNRYTVLCGRGQSFTNAEEIIQSPLSCQSHPFQEIWLMSTLRKLRKKFKNFLFFSPAFFLPYGVSGFKQFVTIHDLTAFMHPETIPWKFARFMQYSITRSAKLANRIIVDSQAVKRELESKIPESKGKTHVIYCGLNPNFLLNDGIGEHTEILAKYNLSPPYYLTLGTIEPRKNIKNLMKTLEFLPEDFQYPLVMIGKSGWRKELYIQELENNVEENRVKLLGYVPDEHLKVLLKNACLSIFVPLYEGFGLPILESMAIGVPVVASKIVSLEEIGGDAPFFCDPYDPRNVADSIMNVLESRKTLQARLQSGIEHARKFTWESAAQKIIKIIKHSSVSEPELPE